MKSELNQSHQADAQYAFFCRTRQQNLLGQFSASIIIVALTWNFAHQPTLLGYLLVNQILVLTSVWVFRSDYTNRNRTQDGLPKFVVKLSIIRQLFLGSLFWLDLEAAQNLTFVFAVLMVLSACLVGTLVTLGPIKKLSQSSTTSLVLPSAMACLYVGHHILGCCLLFFIYVVALRAATQLAAAYEELIQLRGETAETARVLKVNNSELLTLNQDLEAEVANRIQIENERTKLQEKLVTASRQAGKAEIAIGVLHNIGNVMNSVNISTSILKEDFETDLLRRLSASAELLGAQEDLGDYFTKNESSKHFLPFLAQLDQRGSEMVGDFETLLSHIAHVNDVVAAQQSFATSSSVIIEDDPTAVVEAAIQIVRERSQNLNIELVTDFAFTGKSYFDRAKLLQVLVNLISNAIDSIEDSGNDQRTVTVSLRAVDQQLEILVCDTGKGIAAENLKKIFQHGFSTRKDRGGHGFGLHHSINAIREMGGELLAESPGEKQGATLIVRIPRELQSQKTDSANTEADRHEPTLSSAE